MTGLGVAVAGWGAFLIAAAIALRSWHAACERGQAVARACHEVRGPLAAARLGLEAGVGASVSRLRAIQVELARASDALDDLQAVQRIRLEGPEADVVGVRAWLDDAVEAWAPVAAARGRTVRLEFHGPDGVVLGPESRLAQVTGNLIANAIDHGQGRVVVVGKVDRSRVVIEVADGGPGLPAPVATWLRRGAGRDRRAGRDRGTVRRGDRRGREWGRAGVNGRGHGLRIARTVAEAHGGRLTAGPDGPGARLVLTLPLARR